MKPIRAWAVLTPRSLSPIMAHSAKGYRTMALPIGSTLDDARRMQADIADIFPNAQIVRVEICEVPRKKART